MLMISGLLSSGGAVASITSGRFLMRVDHLLFRQHGEARIDRDVGFQDFLTQIPERCLGPITEKKVNKPFRDPSFWITKEHSIDHGLLIIIHGTESESHVEYFAAKIVGA